MSASERLEELNNQINMLLAQSRNVDNPYTGSEYRALIHQIDRLTIKRDLMQDRVNIINDRYQDKQKKDKKQTIIIVFIYLVALIAELIIYLSYISQLN